MNALHKQYVSLEQNVPQILTRALRKALRPPNAPSGFDSLMDRWLAAGDSLTIEDALHQLDNYVLEHDIKPAPMQPTVLSLATPDQTEHGTAGNVMICSVCGGVGHVADACSTPPATAARSCLFCRSCTHSTAACYSKPIGWAPGINQHQTVQGVSDVEQSRWHLPYTSD